MIIWNDMKRIRSKKTLLFAMIFLSNTAWSGQASETLSSQKKPIQAATKAEAPKPDPANSPQKLEAKTAEPAKDDDSIINKLYTRVISKRSSNNSKQQILVNPQPSRIEEKVIDGEKVIMGTFECFLPNFRSNSVIYTVRDGPTEKAKINPKRGRFALIIPIRDAVTYVELTAVDEEGQWFKAELQIGNSTQGNASGAGTSTLARQASPWSVDLGLATSYLSYRESSRTHAFSISEGGLTAKVGFAYRLQRKWELSGNLFTTIQAMKLSSSPTELPASRFYGSNGRVGYEVKQFKTGAIMTYVGWYVWGMQVPFESEATAYGVSQLGGPQLMAVGRFKLKDNRKVYGYTKFASIQSGGSFTSLSNRELAVGGGYQLSKPTPEPRTWMLTVDLSDAASAKKSYSVGLRTLSLGIGIGL